MTAPRDADPLIRAFLDEGMTQLPDRTYDAVRAHIDRTRQRVVIGPWREPRMSNLARVTAAAAAVLVVAITGAVLFGGRGSGQVGSQPASPSPGIESSPTASAGSSSQLNYTWPGRLEPGTYSTRLAWDAPVVFTFTVPPGWLSRDIEILNDEINMSLQMYLVENVYADPCGAVLRDPQIGPSVDDLAVGLLAAPSLNWSEPRPTTLAGHSGTYLEVSAPEDVGCDPSSFVLLRFEPLHCPDGCGGVGEQDKTLDWEGDGTALQRIWILDVDGYRVVIDAIMTPEASASDRVELQGILDLLEITTFTPTPAPQPAGS